MEPLRKKLTIKDIAKIAGVSIGTVDRVVHNRGRVSQETEDRVREIISHTGYSPDVFASRLSKEKHMTVGVIMPFGYQDSGYWSLCLNGFSEAEKDAAVFGIQVKYFFFNRYHPTDIVRAYNESKEGACNALVIAPVVPEPLKKIWQEGNLKVPYCFFDSDIPEMPALFRIGQDSRASGYLAGKLMSLLVLPGDTVGIIDVSEDDFHLQQRVLGFRSYFEDKKIPVTLETAIYDDTDHILEAGQRMKKLVESYPKLTGIFVPNATTHLYTDSYSLKVVGYDVVPQNLQALSQGKIDFLISQQPEKQGQQALSQLIRGLVLQQSVDERIRMPIDIITSENCF